MQNLRLTCPNHWKRSPTGQGQWMAPSPRSPKSPARTPRAPDLRLPLAVGRGQEDHQLRPVDARNRHVQRSLQGIPRGALGPNSPLLPTASPLACLKVHHGQVHRTVAQTSVCVVDAVHTVDAVHMNVAAIRWYSTQRFSVEGGGLKALNLKKGGAPKRWSAHDLSSIKGKGVRGFPPVFGAVSLKRGCNHHCPQCGHRYEVCMHYYTLCRLLVTGKPPDMARHGTPWHT